MGAKTGEINPLVKGFVLVLVLQTGQCAETVQEYTASSGFIFSPNYPDNYENNQNCNWRITVPLNHRVKLTFHDFNLQINDYLTIRDGLTSKSPVIDGLTGLLIPSPKYANGRHMYLNFASDQIITDKGFNASFTAVPIQVNGRWTSWGDWEECTRSCGGGIQKRARSCTNPPPSNNGLGCTGPNGQQKSCNNQPC